MEVAGHCLHSNGDNMNRRFKHFLRNFGFLSCFVGIFGCTNIDCPLDNIVAMTCGLYDAGSENKYTLGDTLTVRAGGKKDTILLNRAYGLQSFLLPLRNASSCDTLLFRFSNSRGQFATDTLYLLHESQVHFESPDCPSAVFHRIGGVRWTSHPLGQMPLTIDKVNVVRQTVNYDDIENLKIYLRTVVGQ